MITFTRFTEEDYKIVTKVIYEINRKCNDNLYTWDEPLAFIDKDDSGRISVFVVGDDFYYVTSDTSNASNTINTSDAVHAIMESLGFVGPDISHLKY